MKTPALIIGMGVPKHIAPPNAGPGNRPGAGIGQNGEICVPLSSLAQPDANDQMQTPEEGDTVTMQVEATVDHIEGNDAYIKPTSINGNAIPENPADQADASDDEEPSDEADEAEGRALRSQALTM